jgi:excisionase family DNA binding protein
LETPLTVKRAAERLDVHEETIRRWIKKGELEAIQVGRTFVISEESLALKEGADHPTAPDTLEVVSK